MVPANSSVAALVTHVSSVLGLDLAELSAITDTTATMLLAQIEGRISPDLLLLRRLASLEFLANQAISLDLPDPERLLMAQTSHGTLWELVRRGEDVKALLTVPDPEPEAATEPVVAPETDFAPDAPATDWTGYREVLFFSSRDFDWRPHEAGMPY